MSSCLAQQIWSLGDPPDTTYPESWSGEAGCLSQ